MNGCLAKAKGPINNDQYGFEWTIMPDGSLQDVHCTGKLDDAVRDCYIDIIKKWHYKPTLSGQKLKMYYEYYIAAPQG